MSAAAKNTADGRLVQQVAIINPDGSAVDTNNPLYVQLKAAPTIDIGAVQILGDDGAVVLGSKSDAAQPDGTVAATIVAYIKGFLATLGLTSGAAVITDANGTVQQYLRGLVKLATSALPAGTNTIGGVTDAGPAWTSVWGIAGVPFASADQHSAVASVTDAPTSGQKLCIDDIIISVDTNMSVTLKEETSGTIMFGPWYCSANSGPMQVTPRGKKKLATADKKLQVITSIAGNITVQVGYHSEA